MTMRYLTLLRHAHAAPADISQSDFDRPLDAQGLAQLPMVERRLAGLAAPAADFMLVSSAQRTRETAAGLAASISPGDEAIVHTREAYLATAQSLCALLRGAPQDARHVVLVGHNPGISDLISLLVADVDVGLPTAGFAHLSIEQPWANLDKAELTELG